MNGSIHDTEARRARWRRYRAGRGLTLESGGDFARGGLGGLVDDFDVRFLVLPADPEGDAIDLRTEELRWLQQEQASPRDGAHWGNQGRGANNSLVVWEPGKNDTVWRRYLALHRHGGIEFGARLASETEFGRAFWLGEIVERSRSALALQAKVIDRWEVNGPYEITAALKNTMSAILIGFAAGWPKPSSFDEDRTVCLDQHLLLRREVDGIDPESIALDLGDRIELAFGTTKRRHIARGS